MFILFLIAAVGIAAGLCLYIYRFLGRYLPSPDRRAAIGRLVAAIALTVPSMNLFSTAGIVLLHFWIISMLADLVFRMLGCASRRVARSCLIPIVITAALMIWGFGNMASVSPHFFTLDTQKPVPGGKLRVVLITDVHYATIQDKSVLAEGVRQIQQLQPDLIILGGDIVEEGTSREDMAEVFEVLGSLRSTYGTYYIYGNHDRQLYASTPKYTIPELNDAITSSGITILCDESVSPAEGLVLVGREDASRPRKPVGQLIGPEETQKLVIVADHQPSGWKENADAGADIQLSGHTHAGQVFPVGQLLELFGQPSSGHYPAGDGDLYVSSGFAGWGFTVRTSEKCEYLVLDIQ